MLRVMEQLKKKYMYLNDFNPLHLPQSECFLTLSDIKTYKNMSYVSVCTDKFRLSQSNLHI